MKNLSLTTLILLFALTSGCGLKEAIGPVSGTSTSDSYQPVSAGSTWKYALQVVGQPDMGVTMKTTGATTVINGKKYYNATSTSSAFGMQTGYYYNDGTIYVTRSTSLQAGVTVDMQYLDLSKAVGETWTSKVNDSGYINGIPGRFSGKILEKNISKTIGGHLFTNVIHIMLDLQYDYGLGTGFETMMTYDYYVAKGVGLIEIDTSLLGAVFSRQNVVSYEVK